MKLKIIAFFLSVVCAYAVPTGTVYKMVQVDTNGVIVKPANFIAANAIVTGTVSTVETDPVFTSSVAGRITLADTNAWYTGSGGGLLDVTASGGILVGSGGGSTRDIGLSTNALTNAAIQAGLVTASITNPLSDRVSVIDTGKVSQAQGVALTNILRGDIADGIDFSAAPTVNGNPVLTNAPTGGTETDPVYTTGLTARLSGILGTAAYSNGTDFVHASRSNDFYLASNPSGFINYWPPNVSAIGNFSWTTNSDGTINISDASETAFPIEVPEYINGYRVTSIGTSALAGIQEVLSFVLPSTITNIGQGALANAKALQSITIPQNVSYLGDSVFNACTGLVSIYFQGDAPTVDANTLGSTATVYIVYGANGWPIPPATFCGLVTEYSATNSAIIGGINANTAAIVANSNAITSATNLAYSLAGINSNAVVILRARTNSCPSEIAAPEIRAYPRGTLYGTNAIVTLSRSTSIGHAWFQVGYQTNALSPFVAIDGYHLASTTNADATFTNVSIPPQARISINVTNLATVTSNFNSDIGFKEP